MKEIALIVAIDQKRGIGKSNDLAWRILKDMQFFQKQTSDTNNPDKQNTVIMGRKTWESIPAKYRPLSGRKNIVLSNNPIADLDNWVELYSSIHTAIDDSMVLEGIEKIYIIGWAQIYNMALTQSLADTLYITQVLWDYNCEVFIQAIPSDYILVEESEVHRENNIQFCFQKYVKDGGCRKEIL